MKKRGDPGYEDVEICRGFEIVPNPIPRRSRSARTTFCRFLRTVRSGGVNSFDGVVPTNASRHRRCLDDADGNLHVTWAPALPVNNGVLGINEPWPSTPARRCSPALRRPSSTSRRRPTSPSARRLPRPPADHGVLSGGLEPGLRRPDGALQRDPPEFKRYSAAARSASRSTTPGATWPSRSTATSTSRCSPTSIRKARSRSAYGVYDDEIGMSERALFVIDGDGIIRWSYVSPIGVNPGAEGSWPRSRRWPTEPRPRHERQLERPRPDRSRRRARPRPGAGDAPGDARRVRRLRVPVLRRGAPDREGARGGCWATAALRLPPLPAHADPPARLRRRPRRQRRPARRAGSGRCTICSTRTRTGSTRDLMRVRRAARPRPGAVRHGLREPRSRRSRPRGLPERRPQRRERDADLLRQRRPSQRRVRPRVAARGARAELWRAAGELRERAKRFRAARCSRRSRATTTTSRTSTRGPPESTCGGGSRIGCWTEGAVRAAARGVGARGCARRAGAEYLAHRAAEPSGPPAIRPLVFRGEHEAGAVVEIRRRARSSR